MKIMFAKSEHARHVNRQENPTPVWSLHPDERDTLVKVVINHELRADLSSEDIN